MEDVLKEQNQDVKIAVMAERIKHITDSIERIEKLVNGIHDEKQREHSKMRKDIDELKKFKVRVVAYATVGSFFGSVLVGLIIKFIERML